MSALSGSGKCNRSGNRHSVGLCRHLDDAVWTGKENAVLRFGFDDMATGKFAESRENDVIGAKPEGRRSQ